jgi:hypothetical protein
MATGRRDEMNETMQSISFHHTSTTANGRTVRDLHPARPARSPRATSPAGESLRARIRTALARTTLGPVGGDHVTGDGQWRIGPGSFPAR